MASARDSIKPLSPFFCVLLLIRFNEIQHAPFALFVGKIAAQKENSLVDCRLTILRAGEDVNQFGGNLLHGFVHDERGQFITVFVRDGFDIELFDFLDDELHYRVYEIRFVGGLGVARQDLWRAGRRCRCAYRFFSWTEIPSAAF